MDGGNWKEMFAAACEGDVELVAYYVKNGVDINYAHPEFLSTPLVASILARQETIALFLLSQGANPLLFSEFDGLRPIQAAVQVGLKNVEARLLELGAPIPPEVETKPHGWLASLVHRFKSGTTLS
jgi:uncharacterized protein